MVERTGAQRLARAPWAGSPLPAVVAGLDAPGTPE